MFEALEQLGVRPDPFSVYTAQELWADPHISERMLAAHLDPDSGRASRTAEFIGRSLRWLQDAIGIGPGCRVVDLGCGPGLYSYPLAAAGASVTGVDFSGRSVRHARASAPNDVSLDYVQGDYLEVDLAGPFDVAIMVGCDYSALSAEQRLMLLGRVRSSLAPGGRFVFDGYGLGALHSHSQGVLYARDLMGGFWAPSPYHGFLHSFVYDDERVTLDKYEIIEADRSRTIYNWLQCFDADAIEQELEAGGFEVELLTGDLAGADYDTDAAEFGVVARCLDRDR